MDYQQAVAFIHSIARFGSILGLRRVRLLLERMGNPQKKLAFIHLAGTNGKGSTCAMLSHALSAAGYKTGLYISPFVLDFRERIQIDNQMIEPEEFAKSATLVKAHWEVLNARGETPSEFETLVACAFDYFVRRQVDIVVLEVGLGGRLDATNIIDPPLVSVITSLGMDHVEYLGKTISAIAFEKCGIIKPGGVTVCYPEQEAKAMEIIRIRCAQEGNPLIIPQMPKVEEIGFFGAKIVYDGLALQVPLTGAHQVKNAATALAALKALGERGFPLSDDAIVRGFAEISFPARLEVLGRDPLIILDGAHNREGAVVLAAALKMLEGKRIHAAMGALSSKDVPGLLGEILPLCESLTALPVPDAPMGLGLPPERLAQLAEPLCDQTYIAQTPAAGIRAAYARCGRDDALLVCGSLYLASEVRPILIEFGSRCL